MKKRNERSESERSESERSEAAPAHSLGLERERHYVPVRTASNWIAYGIAAAAAAIAGMGVMSDDATRGPLLAAGLIGFSAGWWFWQPRSARMRVGPAGIAVDNGAEMTRIRWCEVEQLSMTLSYLELKTKEQIHYVSLASQPLASARIVQEAAQRIMTKVRLSRDAHSQLAKLAGDPAPLLPIEGLQIAGSNCAECSSPLSLERDARLCPRCTAYYHVDHLPEFCRVCGAGLPGRAWGV